jgi:hypothetical protein
LGRAKRTRAKPNAQKSRVSAVFGDRSDPRMFVAQRKQKQSLESRSSPHTTPFTNFTLLWGCAGTRLFAPSSRSSVFIYEDEIFFLYTVGTPRGACWTSFEYHLVPKIIWSFLICPWPGGVTLVYTYSPETTRICHATQRNTTQHNNPVYCNCIPSCCVRIHSVYGRFSRASVEPAVR